MTRKPQSFVEGDLIYAHNYTGHPAWVRVKVIAITRPKSKIPEEPDGIPP